MKKIILIGYSKKTTKIDFYLKKNKNLIIHYKKNLNLKKNYKEYDLIVLYGYRKIIPDQFLKKIKSKIINLHISYLPYNRGAHPNFWAWIDKTPQGITIHKVSKEIDNGDILFQKKIPIKLKGMTFLKSYKILRDEMDSFFSKKVIKIINNDCVIIKKKLKGTYHKKKDLPRNIRGKWKSSVKEYLNLN